MPATGIRAILASLSLAVALQPAFAGTPLPNPPFLAGGFAAPDRKVLRQEDSSRDLVEAYYRRRSNCRRQAIRRLQTAYRLGSATLIARGQSKWSACDAKAGQRYAEDVADRLVKGTPSCLGQPAFDAMRSLADAVIASEGPILACDGGGAAPDPVVGVNVPDKESEAKGESGAIDRVVRTALGTGRCTETAARAAVRGGGTMKPSDFDELQTCLADRLVASDDHFQRLAATNKLPSCLPTTAAQNEALGSQLFSLVLSSIVYCASPSGAFVDGVPGL